MYRYINIAADQAYSKLLPTKQIRNILKSVPECEEDDHHWFRNRSDFPWFRINVATCDAEGNYSVSSFESETANLVELICEDKGDQATQAWFEDMASRISSALNWTIISEIE